MSSGGGGKKQENFLNNPVESVSNFVSNTAGDFSNAANKMRDFHTDAWTSVLKDVVTSREKQTGNFLKDTGYAVKSGNWNNYGETLLKDTNSIGLNEVLKRSGTQDKLETGAERAAREAQGAAAVEADNSAAAEKNITARRKVNILEAGARARATAPGRAQLLTTGNSKNTLLTIKE